ncbi:MAG TPA: hypothetical protein VLG49_05150 [Rhabdochlamydiaceae bacterium]|nr:hypothetical protein [Rhabdochlamydiaceae bacterium]
MHNFPVVISFYTKHTFYQMEVQNLIESCNRFGLEQSIEGVDSFGSWELNCAYKPFFILQKIKQLQRPVLWVDADGMFVRQPECIPVFSSDFATRINEECDDAHPSKVISSTVFANYSEEGVAILEAWAEECRKALTCETRKEEFWDQVALRDAIALKKHSAVIRPLPLSYARIFDHPHDLKQQEPPVIEHYQASRRFKKFINNFDD